MPVEEEEQEDMPMEETVSNDSQLQPFESDTGCQSLESESSGRADHEDCILNLLMYNFALGESEGEEVWEEGSEANEHIEFDFSSSPPALPVSSNSSESLTQRAIVSWIVLFLSSFRAKFSIPDNALSMLLKFIYTLFFVLGRFSGFIALIVPHLPSTLYRFNKSLHIKHE